MKKYINPLKLGLLIAVLANTYPVNADITADVNAATASSTDPAQQAAAVAAAVANAIKNAPSDAVSITSEAVKAAPGFANDIVRSGADSVKSILISVSNKNTGANLDRQVLNFVNSVVSRTVQGDPANSAAIVTAAITYFPQNAAAIVTTAVTASPANAAAIVTAAVTASPTNAAAITTAATTAAPSQARAIARAATSVAPATAANDIAAAAIAVVAPSENTTNQAAQTAGIVIAVATVIATNECKGSTDASCFNKAFEKEKTKIASTTSDPGATNTAIKVIEKANSPT